MVRLRRETASTNGGTMPYDASALAARLLLSAVFLPNGLLKLSDL